MVEVCKIYKEHRDKIDRVKEEIPSDRIIQDLSLLFNALGNTTRTKILLALLIEKELCTCDLSNITGLSVSAVSHQLRILKDRRIVKYRKERKTVYYSLDDKHIVEILKMALDHIKEQIGKNR